jgi:predicted PurR-regulated permease PerM
MQPARQHLLIEHPLAVGFGLFVIFGILRALIAIRDLLAWGFFAVLLAALLSFPVGWLSKLMPRGLAVVLMACAVLGGSAGVGFYAVPRIANQAQVVLDDLGAGIVELEGELKNIGLRVDFGRSLEQQVKDKSASLVSGVALALKALLEGVVGIVLVFALSFFLVHEPGDYRKGLERLIPRQRRQRIRTLFERLAMTLRKWMGGILVSMTLMGTFTAVGLAIAGVRGWLVLGILTFFGTFVPYAGALASAAPGLIVAAAQSRAHFFYAGCVYLLVHIIEGYIVQPMIMKRAVSLKPALLLFWQAAMTVLLGTPGVVIATPLLACVQIAVDHLYVERGPDEPPEVTQWPPTRGSV